MFDPAEELGALFGGGACDLMRKIGGDVAVDENDAAFVEHGFETRFGFEPVTGVKKSGEVGIDGLKWAVVAIQEFADHTAEPGIVLREASRIDGVCFRGKGMFENLSLSVFAAAIDTLDGDE